MRPEVSIVFSTHDRPESLRQAVRSVLTQTCPAREILIIHDGPKAMTPEILAEVHDAGLHCRYERQTTPSLTQSRNRGLTLATGDIVLLLDDDILLPSDYLYRLCRMYEADTREEIDGIGGWLREPKAESPVVRTWNALSAATALCRWGPRLLASRYVRLPAELAGRLKPAWRLYGGAISLRRRTAGQERFDEALTGYAFGEDLEFSFRVGRKYRLFFGPELEIGHEVASGGRPEPLPRGRLYVRNLIHILRQSGDALAGNYVLFAYDLAGTICRYVLWGLLRRRRHNLLFALGMVRQLVHEAGWRVRKTLCG